MVGRYCWCNLILFACFYGSLQTNQVIGILSESFPSDYLEVNLYQVIQANVKHEHIDWHIY